MDWEKCNTKEGIETMITSLSDFNRLIAMRKDCARFGNLSVFYLFGRFELDARGYTLKWQPNFFPDDVYKSIPPILTNNEFFYLFKKYGVNRDKDRMCQKLHLPIVPPAHIVDPISGEGWTIDTCHDAYPIERLMKIDLNPYIGKTIYDLKIILANDDHCIYLFDTLQLVSKNEYSVYDDDDEEGFYTPHDVSEEYTIQSGDVGFMATVQFFHESSLPEQKKMRFEKFISDVELMLTETLKHYGFSDISIKPASLPTQLVHCGNRMSDLSRATMFYFRAHASRVCFGIILLNDQSIMLDLHESGVTSHELMEAADEVPYQEASPDLCFLSRPVLEVFHDVVTAKNLQC